MFTMNETEYELNLSRGEYISFQEIPANWPPYHLICLGKAL